MTAQIDIRFPDIRTPAPSAPGSVSSQRAAEAVTQPMRKRAYRLILLALQSAQRPLSREEIAQRTGYKECGLCGRLDELRIRPAWIEAVDRACVAKSGCRVDGYQLVARVCIACGTHRGMKLGEHLCASCAYDPSTDDAA